jgi:putative SOS response-associated peptidase YedK
LTTITTVPFGGSIDPWILVTSSRPDPASWNVCPTDPMLVSVRSKDGKRIPQQMRWGLVPWWAKDIKVGF